MTNGARQLYRAYLCDQFCAIGFVGALGGIAVSLYPRDLVRLLVHPGLAGLVLWAGLGLLVLAGLRAGLVLVEWARGAEKYSVLFGHQWAPWRYIVLLVPVVFYLLGLPTAASTENSRPCDNPLWQLSLPWEFEEFVLDAENTQFWEAARTKEWRAHYEGKLVRVEGQYSRGRDSRSFWLVRWKVRLEEPYLLRVELDPRCDEILPHYPTGQWLRVTGQVDFQEVSGKPGSYIAVIRTMPNSDHPLDRLVQVIERPRSPFLEWPRE
jgi:hypothetical protein